MASISGVMNPPIWTSTTTAVERRQSCLQRFGREGQGGRGHVGQAGNAPGMHDGGRSGEEGVRRDDHFSTLDRQGAEDDLEGTGAAAHGHCVRHMVAKGERLLELAGARAEGERSVLQRLVDHAQDRLAILR